MDTPANSELTFKQKTTQVEERPDGSLRYKNLKYSKDQLHCDTNCRLWRGDYCRLCGFLKIDAENNYVRGDLCFERESEWNLIPELKQKAATIPANFREKKMYLGYGFPIQDFFEHYNFEKDKIKEHFFKLGDYRIKEDYIHWVWQEYMKMFFKATDDVFEKAKKGKEMDLFFNPFHGVIWKEQYPDGFELPFETMNFKVPSVLEYADCFEDDKKMEYLEWVIKESKLLKHTMPEVNRIQDLDEKTKEFQEAIQIELEFLKNQLESESLQVFVNGEKSSCSKRKKDKFLKYVDYCDGIPENAICGVNQVGTAKKLRLDPRTMTRTAENHFKNPKNNSRKILCYSGITDKWFVKIEHKEYYDNRPKPGRKPIKKNK